MACMQSRPLYHACQSCCLDGACITHLGLDIYLLHVQHIESDSCFAAAGTAGLERQQANRHLTKLLEQSHSGQYKLILLNQLATLVHVPILCSYADFVNCGGNSGGNILYTCSCIAILIVSAVACF